MGRLLLLFILVPLVDMLLLTRISELVGFWNTVALVIVTGMAGAWLSKREGRKAWRRWQEALAQGQLPEDGVIGSLLLLVGSVLLITPGVLTDAVGLTLLIGPSRRFIARLIRPYLINRFMGRGSSASSSGASSSVSSTFRVELGGMPFPGAYQRSPADGFYEEPAPEPAPRRARPEPIRRMPNRIIDADFEVSDEEQ